MIFLRYDMNDSRVIYDSPNVRFDAQGRGILLEPGDEGYTQLAPGTPGYQAPISPTPPPPPKRTRKMADLTDADQKAFIEKIIGTLKNADIKARLIAAGWDPTVRTTNLDNGHTSVIADEGLISQLESALSMAVGTRRNNLDNNYDLASSTVSSIEGALGKNDELVKDLRQFRGSLSQSPTPPPAPTP